MYKKIKVATKATTLVEIRNNLSDINVLPCFVVTYKDYRIKKKEFIKDVLNIEGESLVVRSSSVNEDMAESSNAGRFLSLVNVSKNEDDIENAIELVFKSYGNTICDEDEVLIQPMLKDTKMSGVAFTVDQDTGADYYLINYFEGDDTVAVTSGHSSNLKTFIAYKDIDYKIQNGIMELLICNLKILEKYFGNNALDVEFAIGKDDKVYILQVRPIVTINKVDFFKTNVKDIGSNLVRIYKKVKKLSAKHPFLLGEGTCFGVMPDWNPAEILGARPKKLAISLYKELITDSIWAHQRANYGYRDVTMHPLMISFCGIPYIDSRISFNSFIPAKLHPSIAEKLANYYLDKLRKFPGYHDKTEFEIVYSCYYLGLPEELKSLKEYGFNDNEISRIEFSLLELTNGIINPKEGLYKKDIEKISVLEKNYEAILSADISLVDRIYWLIEECKAYGTLPFAGVARAGFIAVQFLKSFVKMKIISEAEYSGFMNSLNTVNRELSEDFGLLSAGKISKAEFLEKYGHIRPGTYDILSKRYDENFDEYFKLSEEKTKEKRQAVPTEFDFSKQQMDEIQTQLDYNGLLISAEDLILFIRESIEGREKLKFIFTKALSMILKLVEQLGDRAGISVSDMAHLDVSIIKNLYVDLYTGDIKDLFMENINANKRQFESAVRMRLPSLIVNPEDVYSFFLLEEEANYITQKCVTSEVCVLEENADVSDKIVFISSADPGYDYIFSKGIAGLITQFGGANSHMAIRCSELGIPAVIGAGEKLFNDWKSCDKITLDCMKKQVIKIQ